MSLSVALQMDPIERVDIKGDSTFALGLEAESRGHKLYHYDVKDLSFQDGRVTAYARGLTLRREQGNHFSLGAEVKIDLGEDIDVILMRQDPPFDMGYITATHILEHIHPKTLVVNDPASVRNAPEKNLPDPIPRPDASDPDHHQ